MLIAKVTCQLPRHQFPIGTCRSYHLNLPTWCARWSEAIDNETLEYGCDVVLGPGMSLHHNRSASAVTLSIIRRDPVCRSYQTTFMQVIAERGRGVGVPKHFAVNLSETQPYQVDGRLSQRALRELYLKVSDDGSQRQSLDYHVCL